MGDAEKRKKYDELGNQDQFQNGDEFNPANAKGYGDRRYQHSAESDNSFSDFFNMFFSGSSNNMNDQFRGKTTSNKRYRSIAQDGEDSEAEITITPEDGFYGHEMRVAIQVSGSKRTITFKIPAGIKPGEKIKLAGQGAPGRNGGKDGDLYIEVHFSDDGKLKLNGLDLEMTLDLMPWDAALGSKEKITIIDDTIALKISPGIQTGGKIRVAGKGYKDRTGNRGDLYIVVRIVNPKVLTDELKDLYIKIKQLQKQDIR